MAFEELIETLKRGYEAETGWGDCSTWTNQDFIHLSERIRERTGVTLSHVTLKRIWGKVKYDSLPNTYTLDTLVHYIGFESWRSFVATHNKNGNHVLVQEPENNDVLHDTELHPRRKNTWLIPVAIVVIAIPLMLYFVRKKEGPEA